jgi:hypothetical protein
MKIKRVIYMGGIDCFFFYLLGFNGIGLALPKGSVLSGCAARLSNEVDQRW